MLRLADKPVSEFRGEKENVCVADLNPASPGPGDASVSGERLAFTKVEWRKEGCDCVCMVMLPRHTMTMKQVGEERV